MSAERYKVTRWSEVNVADEAHGSVTDYRLGIESRDYDVNSTGTSAEHVATESDYDPDKSLVDNGPSLCYQIALTDKFVNPLTFMS